MRTSSDKTPDHGLLEHQLAAAGVRTGAAEAHGVLCGLLCSGMADAPQRWYAELFDDTDGGEPLVRECQQGLNRLFQDTRADMEGPGLGFSPLLPDDARPLQQRARALVEWCQGFLYGVGVCGLAEGEFSAETREALQDLAEITRLDWERLEESEQDEEYYTELAEFVWVAAMLVREDRLSDVEGRP